MIKLKNGLPDFPENWDEVSFKTSLKLIDWANSTENSYKLITKAEAIRRILDIPPGAKVEGMEVLYRAASFLDKPAELDELPQKLGPYTIPQDVTAETAEQFEDISNQIQKAYDSKDLLVAYEAVLLYAAIYLQPLWYATAYDSEQARLLAKILTDYPCTEVMSAGSFFQARFLNTASGLSMNYLRRSLPLKKKRRGLRSLIKRLGHTLRLT